MKFRKQFLFSSTDVQANEDVARNISAMSDSASDEELIKISGGVISSLISLLIDLNANLTKNEFIYFDLPFINMEGEIKYLEDFVNELDKKELSIGVFGECSSGKSTLINVLLERDCAATGILPGTTSKVAKYENCMNNEILDKNNKDFPIPGDNIVLIDMPGITDNKAFTDLALHTAAGCDLLLVMINLCTGPFSMELVKNIRKVSGPCADNCIFIGTHADLLNKGQLQKMEKYFESKIKEYFGAEHPFYFVSLFKDMDEIQPAYKIREGEGTKKIWNIRKEIFENLEKSFYKLRINKTVRLLSSTLAELRGKLLAHTQLLQSKMTSLDILDGKNFFEEYRKQIEDKVNYIVHDAVIIRKNSILIKIKDLRQKINEHISNMQYEVPLERYVNENIISDLLIIKEIINEENRYFCDDVTQKFKAIIRRLNYRIDKNFDVINKGLGNINKFEFSNKYLPIKINIKYPEISGIHYNIYSNENLTRFFKRMIFGIYANSPADMEQHRKNCINMVNAKLLIFEEDMENILAINASKQLDNMLDYIGALIDSREKDYDNKLTRYNIIIKNFDKYLQNIINMEITIVNSIKNMENIIAKIGKRSI